MQHLGIREIALCLILLTTITSCTAAGGKKPLVPITKSAPKVPTTSTTTTPAPSTIPSICIDGITTSRAKDDDDDAGSTEPDPPAIVQIIEGDAMLSVITIEPITALFVINRINEVRLVSGDFEIGIRAIHATNPDDIENLLLQEVQYLQLCVDHPIGIFLDADFYKRLLSTIDDLEYNIWPIESSRELVFPKVSHLLSELPWGEKIASVEILGENLDVYNDFMDAARNDHLCLMHFRSPDNVYILLGSNMALNFKENGTVFAVPTGRVDRAFIGDLPSNTYILMEPEIDLKIIDENSTTSSLDESLIGQTILPSKLFAIASPFVDMTRWLNESLRKNCRQQEGVYLLETCYNFLTFEEDWSTNHQRMKPIDVLEALKLRRLSHLMTFEMTQKVVEKGVLDMREIASQSFVTNVTTYYHYNEGNKTSHAGRSKFGDVFSCQYGDSSNRKYPFYFEGESVMSWRFKTDTWTVAGLTAAVLGIIFSLAILVFIVIRITVGDVFEGNPVSSIMLLVSLILLFLSFTPFAMEYASGHRNSHVTYEDAEVLNSLCAVRVFFITLCYCFTFSLLLCRGLMLASIGSEGGFLSHVNGYIQSVICAFSTLVQLGLSTQLIIVMHIANENISCDNIFYGHYLWALLSYDFLLLVFLVGLTPLIYRSQRNYREGILLVVGGILCFIIWCTWITVCFFGAEWRDAAIPLGIQATGWAILVGIMIPRTFLIVRGIERSDIAQALPSLTSLAFAQNNQYSSEQSVYECVNPAMRSVSRESGLCDQDRNMVHSPSASEMPTLPLRGGGARRHGFANNRTTSMAVRVGRQPSPPPSSHPSIASTARNNKITRF